MPPRWLFAPVLALLLTACGGGGSGGPESATAGGTSTQPDISPAPDNPQPPASDSGDTAGSEGGGADGSGGDSDGGDTPTSPPDDPTMPAMQPVNGSLTFKSPHFVTADNSGNLYVGDSGERTVTKIRPDGTMSVLAGNPDLAETVDGQGSEAGFSRLGDMTADSNGNIYVVDGRVIRKISADGTVTTISVTSFDNESPDELRYGDGIVGIDIGPSENILVGIHYSWPHYYSAILTINQEGDADVLLEESGSDNLSSKLRYLSDVAVSPEGIVHFALDNMVYRLIDGEVVPFTSTIDPILDMAFDAQGNLYTAEDYYGGKHTPAHGVVSKITPDGGHVPIFREPYGTPSITLHPDRYMYFTFYSDSVKAIMRIAPGETVSTYVDAATYSESSVP